MSNNSFVKLAVYGSEPPSQPLPPPPPVVEDVPKIWGLPLKYVSLITLAVQNAALTIIMHYSRVSTPSDRSYSAASAVLLNELLKGSISLCIALARIDGSPSRSATTSPPKSDHRYSTHFKKAQRFIFSVTPHPVYSFVSRSLVKFRRLGAEVFSPDCWKLSIPAILYVIQNNLQFVAASNLDVATFQVTYQMKILTTAAFSVVLLRKRLSTVKWLSLLGLALGVGIVQIQTQASHGGGKIVEHVMYPLRGFIAVSAACMTSGLAGVYFEMVLKGSKADLWVRNVQLSLFSLLPALVPILFSDKASSGSPVSGGWFGNLFENFGFWAWCTVLIQVFGGLITAIVIKYSDNILKGFATSLSIIISFLASVALFDFSMTVPFVLGASVVLASTWFYNQPEQKASEAEKPLVVSRPQSNYGYASQNESDDEVPLSISKRPPTLPGSPVTEDAPILGLPSKPKKNLFFGSLSRSSSAEGAALGGSMGASLSSLKMTPTPSSTSFPGNGHSPNPYSGYSTPARHGTPPPPPPPKSRTSPNQQTMSPPNGRS